MGWRIGGRWRAVWSWGGLDENFSTFRPSPGGYLLVVGPFDKFVGDSGGESVSGEFVGDGVPDVLVGGDEVVGIPRAMDKRSEYHADNWRR